jgi:hypothetical protein
MFAPDIPFQLVYERHFGQPLLTKAVVLAHDVDDFSKIWQAMGRSRTMNQTSKLVKFCTNAIQLPPNLLFLRIIAPCYSLQYLQEWH